MPDREKKIEAIIAAANKENRFDALMWAIDQIARNQVDSILFLEDTLGMFDDEAVEMTYEQKIESA